MNKPLLLLIILSYYSNAYGQVVQGTVRDADSNEAIAFASVYYDQTFMGTVADKNGAFSIGYSKDGKLPLVISAIGYYSSTIHGYSPKENLNIRLKPKAYPIQDVNISAASLEKQRKKYLRKFKKEFIGTSANAKHCHILNEEDITFNYSSDSDTIEAYALKPLIIENKALGYSITYYLNTFKHLRGKFTNFRGSIVFNEDHAQDNASSKSIIRNRALAYKGSRMHFIRALHLETLDDTGFRPRDAQDEYLNVSDLVHVNAQNQRFLINKGRISVYHYRDISTLVFSADYVYISPYGYFDPIGLQWQGYMSLQRMADWLPYEYILPEE